MKQVLLDYDPLSGNITTKEGLYIGISPGLTEFKDERASLKSLIELKNAGFSADEMIELNRKGLI